MVTPFFHPASVYGGAPRAAFGLSQGLIGVGCEMRVLTTDAAGPNQVLDVPTGNFEEIEPGLSVNYCRRWLSEAVAPGLLTALPRAISWADVVHLQSVYSFPTLPVLSLCRLQDKPLVWTPHGALLRWQGSSKPAAKRLWEAVCETLCSENVMLHCTSPEEAEASAKRIPGVQIFVSPNGVELPSLAKPAPRRSPVEGLSLLFLGRLHPQKGIDRLLEACAKLARGSDVVWKLCIAGGCSDGYDRVIQAKITELQLGDRVRMVGHVDGAEKERLFYAADVLVAPSHRENFGIAVAEALARARPVIVSKGMPWSIVEEQGCGLWVDNDPASLAEAIEKIAGEARDEMGARGRAYVERQLDWAVMALQMRDRYTALIG
jgi:glycosyltransferase involved in cell wall biosynthesis